MEELLKRIIDLAKLNFNEKELKDFINECEKIVNYFSILKKIYQDKENNDLKEDEKCPLREDWAKESDKSFLKELPNFQQSYFRIKKIL